MQQLTADAAEFPPKETLTFGHIFSNIWLSPRTVFRRIQELDYSDGTYALLFLGGVSGAIGRSADKAAGGPGHLFSTLAVALLAGGLLGWLAYYIYAALLSWTGDWLNAKGGTDQLSRVVAYALIPTVLALLPRVAVLMIKDAGANDPGSIFAVNILETSAIIILRVIETVLGIWGIVILVAGVAEIQQLSVGKAILNAVLPLILLIVPAALIMTLVLSKIVFN